MPIEACCFSFNRAQPKYCVFNAKSELKINFVVTFCAFHVTIFTTCHYAASLQWNRPYI